MSDKSVPQAIVREMDGQLVLDDPAALAMIQAVGKHNCARTLEVNADRVAHFKKRVAELCLSTEDVVIVVLNVDDPNGELLADALMPGNNWQEIRDRGETPFARGIAKREGLQGALEILDKAAAEKLQNMKGLVVVVVDHCVAEIFSV